MSKLSERLELEQHDYQARATTRNPPLLETLSVGVEIDREATFHRQYKMKLQATFYASCWATPGSSGVNSVHARIRDMRQSIVNQVFGEFRPMLDKLRRAALDENNERIHTLVTELEEMMFKV